MIYLIKHMVLRKMAKFVKNYIVFEYKPYINNGDVRHFRRRRHVARDMLARVVLLCCVWLIRIGFSRWILKLLDGVVHMRGAHWLQVILKCQNWTKLVLGRYVSKSSHSGSWNGMGDPDSEKLAGRQRCHVPLCHKCIFFGKSQIKIVQVGLLD